MNAIPISNWWCPRCRKLIASVDLSLERRHYPKDPNEPRCGERAEFRTIEIESGEMGRAFDDLDYAIDAVQG